MRLQIIERKTGNIKDYEVVTVNGYEMPLIVRDKDRNIYDVVVVKEQDTGDTGRGEQPSVQSSND